MLCSDAAVVRKARAETNRDSVGGSVVFALSRKTNWGRHMSLDCCTEVSTSAPLARSKVFWPASLLGACLSRLCASLSRPGYISIASLPFFIGANAML